MIKLEDKVKLIAHRGLSGLAPENSLSAFEIVTEKYYGSEVDIHSTLDNELVVFHDHNLIRTTGIDKNINVSTYDELKKIKLTSGNNIDKYNSEYIPLLKDYLEICSRKDLHAIIEIKEVHNETLLNEVIELVKSYNYYNNSTIISFNLQYLIKLREVFNDLSLQYLVGEINDDVIEMCVKHKLDVDVNYGALTKEQVKKCHDNNILVNVWTVDDYNKAIELIDMGVDFITTNIL